MGNFTFLENRWSDLARLGDLSEKYVYSDPNTSVIKQGMLAEIMVKYMLAYDGIKEPDYDNTHANRIRLLKRNDLLPHEIDHTLYILRKDRNHAAHNGADEGEKALNNLPLLYELCVWYMQTYGDYGYNPVGYVPPMDITVSLDELEKENRELEERNKALLIELQRIQKSGKSDGARRAIAYKKALNVKLSEAQTRELIDEQLRRVGWDADTEAIRYSKGIRPAKGKNLAIAEWPTDSGTGNGGYADYALFIGEKMVGIIEAKRKHTNVSSVLDGQCKEYARRIKIEHEKYVLKQYGEYKVPFLFATNGRDYIKQYEEMSGIWFLDTRHQFNTSKALAGWPSPEGLEQDLERDIAKADEKLVATGYELLEDSNGLALRYYQVEAVKAAEKAIAEHKNTVLLAMATGTGKTRTVLGMIYRFLSAKRFKRILYLVDRTALGDQAMDTFKEVKLEDLKTLNQLYDIKDLGEKEFEKDTRVHIATVQSLVKRILYNESDVSIDFHCWNIRKTAIVQEYDLPINTNQAVAFIRLISKEKILPRYLRFLFDSPMIQNCLLEKTKVTSIPNLTLEIISSCPIPLSPPQEQKRIMERIESLFAKLDEAKEKIQFVQNGSDDNFASAIHEALGGNLTEEWRKQNGISRSGWKKDKLGNLGCLERGRSKHRPRNDPRLFGGAYPFIQTGDVAESGVYIEKHKQTLSEFGLAQSRMFPKGTLCITIAANIGDVAILSYDCCFPDSVVGFTPYKDVESKYIYYMMSELQKEIEANAPATAQKNINLKILNDIDITIPSVIEQRKIIAILDDLYDKKRQVKEKTEQIVDVIDRMKKSILAKAFSGKLGTNNLEEESSVVLLEQILEQEDIK